MLAHLVSHGLESKGSTLPPEITHDEPTNPSARMASVVSFAESIEDDTFVRTHIMSTPKLPRGASAEFRNAEQRRPVVSCVAPQASSLQRPDFEDALRRVSAVVHRHIEVCERRRDKAMSSAPDTMETGEFHDSAMELFGEQEYVSPQFKMRFLRLPLGRPGAVYAMQQVEQTYAKPSSSDIYSFISVLFNSARLSSECSIVCLIYVERLMEKGNVPLTRQTWRPVLLCGLLLSHKVWQDHACWNIEFTQVYPQFSLAAINKLEKRFLERINWDLYIKQSLYAQYYFGLRSLSEQKSFRQRYNATVMQGGGGTGAGMAPHMDEVTKRSDRVKKEALLLLSKSM
mmetsp:Transcript_40207/g.79169  ORF Transcript_40207/g.79169 Transcript_40207/m.79169 type:complete len:343 (-) Transcript_40207:199-1227(-)